MTRFRSPEYLAWVAGQPCASCRSQIAVQAHHLKGRGGLSGAGLKAPDSFAMPLCFECHERLHRGDRRLTNSQWEFMARTLARFIEDTAAGLGDKAFPLLLEGIREC